MLTYPKFLKLKILLLSTKFKWLEIYPRIFQEPVEAVEFLNSMIDSNMEQGDFPPRPSLEQQCPDDDEELAGALVWDGVFGMIGDQPAYIGSDGPSGGSGISGRYIILKPDSVIYFE